MGKAGEEGGGIKSVSGCSSSYQSKEIGETEEAAALQDPVLGILRCFVCHFERARAGASRLVSFCSPLILLTHLKDILF